MHPFLGAHGPGLWKTDTPVRTERSPVAPSAPPPAVSQLGPLPATAAPQGFQSFRATERTGTSCCLPLLGARAGPGDPPPSRRARQRACTCGGARPRLSEPWCRARCRSGGAVGRVSPPRLQRWLRGKRSPPLTGRRAGPVPASRVRGLQLRSLSSGFKVFPILGANES